MSPASGDHSKQQIGQIKAVPGFHSINVPSEWGQGKLLLTNQRYLCMVSIQLMSPASGDFTWSEEDSYGWSAHLVSIQLMSPASGDIKLKKKVMVLTSLFPFN